MVKIFTCYLHDDTFTWSIFMGAKPVQKPDRVIVTPDSFKTRADAISDAKSLLRTLNIQEA